MTRSEKIQAIAVAIHRQYDVGNPVTMETVIAVCPVSRRSVQALFMTAWEEIAAAAGLTIRYFPSDGYQPSGNGAFGRLGGGARASYNGARISVSA